MVDMDTERIVRAVTFRHMKEMLGMTAQDIVDKYNSQYGTKHTPGFITAHWRDLRKYEEVNKVIPFPVNGKTYHLKRYDIAPFIYADQVIDIGDTHFPTANWTFLAGVLKAAEHIKRTKGHVELCITGDLVNGDAVTSHPKNSRVRALQDEFNVAATWLDMAAQVFDCIHLLPGNHCKWWESYTKGVLDMNDFYDLLLSRVRSDKVKVYTSTFATIAPIGWQAGDGGTWLTTHTHQYSKVRGRNANIQSQKRNGDVLTHHEHHLAMGRDDWNRANYIAVGGGHDNVFMRYVWEYTSTHVEMVNNAVWLDEGIPTILAPYPRITKWHELGVDPSAMYGWEEQKRLIRERKLDIENVVDIRADYMPIFIQQKNENAA